MSDLTITGLLGLVILATGGVVGLSMILELIHNLAAMRQGRRAGQDQDLVVAALDDVRAAAIDVLQAFDPPEDQGLATLDGVILTSTATERLVDLADTVEHATELQDRLDHDRAR